MTTAVPRVLFWLAVGYGMLPASSGMGNSCMPLPAANCIANAGCLRVCGVTDLALGFAYEVRMTTHELPQQSDGINM